MRYSRMNPSPVTPRQWKVGDRVKLDGDRRWWTVKAVTPNFAALTRQAEFRPSGTNCYTVLDWRHGVRGPCDLLGQTYGDGSYSETECFGMLSGFEAGQLQVSQRNWVPIKLVDLPVPVKG